MVEPAKNSIWNYLIPLWQLEQVSSTFGRRGVEVGLTSHCPRKSLKKRAFQLDTDGGFIYDSLACFQTVRVRYLKAPRSDGSPHDI